MGRTYKRKYRVEVAKHLGYVWIEKTGRSIGILLPLETYNFLKSILNNPSSTVEIPEGECPGYFMEG